MAGASDLFRAADESLAAHILNLWSWLLAKKYSVVGTSLFADVFLKDEDGLIDMLDLVSGEVKQVAYCIEEFEYELRSDLRRNEWLMESLVRKLRDLGVVAGPGQCIAFRTPPALNGPLEASNVVVWDILKYHTGMSSVFRQIRGLPPGTEIRAR